MPPSTLKVALTQYVDIGSCPSQEMIQTFMKHATDESQIAELEKLSTDLEAYVLLKAKKPDLYEFLQMFPSIKLPAAVLVASLNKLMPRA